MEYFIYEIQKQKTKKVANHRPLPYSTANYQNSFIRASKCKPQTTLSIHIPLSNIKPM